MKILRIPLCKQVTSLRLHTMNQNLSWCLQSFHMDPYKNDEAKWTFICQSSNTKRPSYVCNLVLSLWNPLDHQSFIILCEIGIQVITEDLFLFLCDLLYLHTKAEYVTAKAQTEFDMKGDWISMISICCMQCCIGIMI